MTKNIDLIENTTKKYSIKSMSGGRSLTAVWENESLDIYQSSILLYLGSQVDFRGDFSETRWVSIDTLCKKCKMKRTTAFKAIKFLQDNKYITKHHRYYEGRQIANAYAITEKIFQEYDILLENKCSKENAIKISRPLDEPQGSAKRIPEGSPDEPQGSAKRTQSSLHPSLRKNPSLSPSFSADAKKAEKIKEKEIRKAVAALSLIYKPADGRFWDLATVRECAEVALEKFGMEAIMALRDDAIKDEVCGTASFDQMNVFKMIAQRVSKLTHPKVNAIIKIPNNFDSE